MTVIRVATPMIRPRTVRDARSLCARMESTASPRLSATPSMSGGDPSPAFAYLYDHFRGGVRDGEILDLLAVDFHRAGFDLAHGVAHRLRQPDLGQEFVDADGPIFDDALRQRHHGHV